jgi:hypothetical protein
MSDAIHHLRTLHNNPFIFKAAFTAFFNTMAEKDRAFLLSYLLLPIVLNHQSREYLKNANSKSSLRTMLHNRKHLHGLDQRVATYREITNITIQHMTDCGDIEILDDLRVRVVNLKRIDDPSPAGVVKAGHRLGVFFEPYDVPTVFRMLGVMSL